MSSQSGATTRRMLRVGTAISTAALLALTAAPADAGGKRHHDREPSSERLREAVTVDGIREHLENLQAIADANDGTRASGTPGYAASVEYVMNRMEKAGYDVTKQTFDFPFFQENSPSTLRNLTEGTTYENPGDFQTMTFSGSGTGEGEAVPVDTTFTAGANTSGCEAEDFANFPSGSVALIQRGSCAFGLKAMNAQDAGATAVIIFNTGTEGATESYAGTLGQTGYNIPVVGTSFALGQELNGDDVQVTVDAISETRETYNVIADSRDKGRKGHRGHKGRDDEERSDEVVMAGAHLDSVPEGPGINDNGSGSASLLEVAEQMAKMKTEHPVRFAWWGAEELGLLGAEHYVTDLEENDPEALEKIGLYLNFDMVGSPNYVRFVYDGDNSAFGEDDGAAVGPEGSAEIEQVFTEYFASQGLESEETPFNGRSDYGPFIAVGIPAGGLFTGAEGIKTEEQAAIYGGTAGEAYDPCYHAECDDIDNINWDAIDEMSDAVAHAMWTFAKVDDHRKGWDDDHRGKGHHKGHKKGHKKGHGHGHKKGHGHHKYGNHMEGSHR